MTTSDQIERAKAVCIEDDAVQPSASEAVRFLMALDDAGAGGRFSFQTFDDTALRDDKSLAKIRHGTLDQHWPELVKLNNRGAGVFVTVNVTDLKGRKTGNITKVRALFADLDGAPLDPVATCSTPPHIIVKSSPGRWHCYWLVRDMPLDQFEPMQIALAARFNGDLSVKDLPRVLRVPGFVHRKAAPFLSLLQDVNPHPAYTFEQLRAAFPLDPKPEPKPERPSDGITNRHRGEAWARKALDASTADLTNAGEGSRHKTLLAKAVRMGTMVARGWIDTHEVRRALFAAAESNGQIKQYGIGHFNNTFKDGIAHGILTPHPDLPDNDPPPDAATQQAEATEAPTNGTDAAATAIAPRFSDEGLALLFSARHADDLRYVALWNKWLRYDGKRWEFEETLRAFDAARALCRELAAQCEKKGTAKAIASAKTVAAVVTLARADRRQAATTAQWDRDSWLLGTPDGTVDLRTGKLQPPKLDDHITKIARTTPGGHCPQWMAFLKLVTNDDVELQNYLQRVCGYCLTGVTSEHQFFFLYGKGANGKSAFLSTVSGILGDYHEPHPWRCSPSRNVERHPTDLAMLRGARLVTAIETEEGKRWDESQAQGTDRRRPDRGAVHAAGFLRVHPAIQVDDRGQP